MSSAGGGPAAAVSKPWNCNREMVIGPTTHVIMHSWRPKTGRGLELITTLVGSKHKNRPSNKMTCVENTEHALSSAAAEMAHKILKNRRDRFLKIQEGNAGGSSSGGRSRHADVEVADPAMAALRGSKGTRSGVIMSQRDEQEAEADWKKQSAETFLASMDRMGADNALQFLESKGSEAAKDIRQEIRDLKAKAAVGVSLQRAIKVAMKKNKTNEGSRTRQTLLTAAAFRRPANDDEEEQEEEDEEEAMSMSSKRKAAAMGVTRKAWGYAVKRMKRLRADLHPTGAIKNGVYWFWPRVKRSDAASEELVQLMRQHVRSSPQKTGGKYLSADS